MPNKFTAAISRAYKLEGSFAKTLLRIKRDFRGSPASVSL